MIFTFGLLYIVPVKSKLRR